MVCPEHPYEDISEAIMGDKTAHKKRDVNNVLHHCEEDKRKPAAKSSKKKHLKDSKKNYKDNKAIRHTNNKFINEKKRNE